MGSEERTRRRHALLLWGLLLLVSCIRETVGQQYDYQRYQGDTPRRDIPTPVQGGNRKWGLVKSGAVSAVVSWGVGQLYYRWRQRRIQSLYKKNMDKIKAKYQAKMEELLSQYSETSDMLNFHAEVIDAMIAQVEDVLNDPSTDPSKKKMAEFKMPDSDNDNLISRKEFDAYLKSYFAAHPELVGHEFPGFEDFDGNADGMVTFQEWKQFITKLEAEQEKAEAAQKAGGGGGRRAVA